MLARKLEQMEAEAGKKLDNQQKQADEALERMEEELASYQDQLAAAHSRVQELEKAESNALSSLKSDSGAADEAGAEERQLLTGRVEELRSKLQACENELQACKEEHENTVARLQEEVQRVRESEAKTKEKCKSIVEVCNVCGMRAKEFGVALMFRCRQNAKVKARSIDDARKLAQAEAEALRDKLLALEETQASATASLVVPEPSQEPSAVAAAVSEDELGAGSDPAAGQRLRELEEELTVARERVAEAEKLWKEAAESGRSRQEEATAQLQADAQQLRDLAADLKSARESERQLQDAARVQVAPPF